MEDEGFNGNVNDQNEASVKIMNAIEKSKEWENRIPVGVFYENDLPTFEERLQSRIENYDEYPPAVQKIMDNEGYPNINVDGLVDNLKIKSSP